VFGANANLSIRIFLVAASVTSSRSEAFSGELKDQLAPSHQRVQVVWKREVEASDADVVFKGHNFVGHPRNTTGSLIAIW